jgi:hypothetical protein
VQLAPKPPPDQRTTFQWTYFAALVDAWALLPDEGPARIIEDTPWAYLTRHSVHVDVHTRQAAHKLLTTLPLPTFHIVLHTSGVTVGRRHPTLHHTPEAFSPHALRQMGLLAHLPAPSFPIDATPEAAIVAERVQRLLGQRAFRVQAATVEKAEINGMEHVSGVPPLSEDDCQALATRLHLTSYDVSTPQGRERLARLAVICQQNPDIVNQALDPKTRGLYF